MKDNHSNRIDCRKCKFFYITWDKNFPYGCKALGFKSMTMPSIQAMKASGLPCQYFSPKTKFR
jgi:hypothetical protein